MSSSVLRCVASKGRRRLQVRVLVFRRAVDAGDSRARPLAAPTRLLLEAPIVPTLLRLAAPNVLVMIVQASVGLIETYFFVKLGTDALAGVALVFPVLMLMQMMSAGAMGGGISSAIARTPGRCRCVGPPCAGDRRELRARLHPRRAGRRPMALRCPGRKRGLPRCRAGLFQ